METSPLQLITVFNIVRIFTVAALAFFVNLFITYLWTKVLYKYFRPGKSVERANDTFWGETPVFNNLHRKKEGTPTMGGFPIWLTVTLLTVFFYLIHYWVDGFWSKVNFLSRSQTLMPLGFLILAGLVGMADDMLGIFKKGGFSLRSRLILYTAVSIVGVWWFYVKLGCLDNLDTACITSIPFIGAVSVGIWYIPYFLFITIATAFSVNETDGLDGLAGGVLLTIFGALAVIAFDQGLTDLVTFIVAIMGALVAFLWFNIYPARFFMGDTGVMALGFLVGVIGMLTGTALLLPVIAVIPLIESLSVVIQTISKKLRKKKVFISTPIHHTFEALGWPETQITMRFWMINAIGAIIGLIIFLVDSKLPPLL